jgi:phosphatidylglycerophosphatase A
MAINTFKKSSKALPIPESIWQNPLHFIAFGFGSGALPYAPGTWGTLLTLPIYLAMETLPLALYFSITFFITLGSIWLCDKISREINVHDHPGMCLDEVVGFLITMIGAPHGMVWVIIGFLLFRLFDIWKPAPIGYIDKHIGGGFGIILDDMLAGVYAWIILHLLFWIF